MAVEIKEIVIKAVLTNEEQSNPSFEGTGAAKEAVIQECVAQVLKVLQKKNLR